MENGATPDHRRALAGHHRSDPRTQGALQMRAQEHARPPSVAVVTNLQRIARLAPAAVTFTCSALSRAWPTFRFSSNVALADWPRNREPQRSLHQRGELDIREAANGRRRDACNVPERPVRILRTATAELQ